MDDQLDAVIPMELPAIADLSASGNSFQFSPVGNDESNPEMELDAGNDGEGDLSEALSSQVFGNDMLLEAILLKVIIHPRKGTLERSDICSVRQVRKRWLHVVSDLLRRRREPLHQLVLTKENSRNDMPYCKENGKLLTQFVEAVAGDTPLYNNLPTFSLKVEAEFFRRENHKDLSDCLIKCGSELVTCELTFPLNSSMVLLFHSFTLPKLQRLTVQFSDIRLTPSAVDDGSTVMNNNHTIYPLQTILNETRELKELNLRQVHMTGPYPHLIPIGFEYLNLPQTITKLLIDSPVRNSDLTLLLKNDMTNLTHLRLFASLTPYDDETIYDILNKYKSTLRVLNFRGAQLIGSNGQLPRIRPVTLIRFPVMEKLETITVTSQFWELEGEERIRWDKQLPSLNELRLLSHTAPMLRKWANTHAVAPTVKRLFISLVHSNPMVMQQQQNAVAFEAPAPLTMEMMQGIHLTMPFLTCLEVSLCGLQTCALKYVFLEMKCLEKLAISVRGSPEGLSAVFWDALLIGVPTDMAVSLRRNPSFWDNFELKDNKFPSIRNLTSLRSLALVENFMKLYPPPPDHPLISDMSFHFSLLKIPTLKYLLLAGRFRASASTAERWKKEKGVAITTMKRP